MSNIEKKKKILVHLHTYYTDQINNFIRKIKIIENLADIKLVVTTESTDRKNEIISKLNNHSFFDADINVTPNRGFDVGPFVDVINNYNLNDYDYVLKLHTKSRGETGKTLLNNVVISNSVWEDIMIDSLIGSQSRFSKVLEIMNKDNVGMAAASMCIINDDVSRLKYYFSRVNDELSKINLPTLKEMDKFSFVAGTMFIVRAELLKPLNQYSINDFGVSYSFIHDWTLAHTFERLFSGLIYSQGYEIYGLESKQFKAELKQLERKRIREEKKNIGESFFDNADLFVRRQWSKILFRIAKTRVVRNSEFFNRNWYRWKYLKKENNQMAPEEHYLEIGHKMGYNPSPLFNGNIYQAFYPDLSNMNMDPLLHYECYGKYEHRLVFNNTKWNVDESVVRNSELFDEKWYLDNNPDVKNMGVDPALHYFVHGGSEGRDPSIHFCSNEYLEIHPEVKASLINPLCHYEQYGYFQGEEKTYLDIKNNSKHIEHSKTHEYMFDIAPVSNRRSAIVSISSDNGGVNDSLIVLLKGLKKVADNIIVVADDDLDREDIDRIAQYVCSIITRIHNSGCFRSYKLGYDFLRKSGLLEEDVIDELVLVNDSIYGPIYPFEESFDNMKELEWDYWNYTVNVMNDEYIIDSSFCVFGRKVIDSMLLDEFFNRARDREDKLNIDFALERDLSLVLDSQKIVGESFVLKKDQEKIAYDNNLIYINDYRVPLIKKKIIYEENKEYDKIMELIRQNNKELSDCIESVKTREYKKSADIEKYHEHLEKIRKLIRNKMKRKDPIKVAFLIFNASIFAAKSLLDRMLEDSLFEPRIIIIPDTRFDKTVYENQLECRNELLRHYDQEIIDVVRPDDFGFWPDVLNDMDIVCYPSPYNNSIYNYNVRYATEQNFLPIIVNYGYSSTSYDTELLYSQNYSYHWKVFFEHKDTYKDYKKLSKNDNSVLVGYIKMDDMKRISEKQRKRKRILIAIHHSIEKGFNDSLSLSNFLKYYKYFMKLPDKYPNIDFVFRPHPYLRKALEKRRNWNEKKLDKYISNLTRKNNAQWIEDSDYFEEFVNSDGCIQDCGSFLVEYMYTRKPCCYMLKDPSDIENKFAPLGKKCLEQCYISYNTDDIDRFINDVIIGENDYKKKDRDKLSDEIMVNYPHAAEKALQIIKDSIMDSDKE